MAARQFGLLLGLPVAALVMTGLLLPAPVRAQAQPADVYYSQQPIFRIPYQTDPGERRLKEVQLYVSVDQGRSWHSGGVMPPQEQSYFKFTAERDGLYWFAVRTVDADGRGYPQTLDGLRPGLKVVVDTAPPRVTLRALTAREGEAAVEWEVRDENLDPASLRLEYRYPGAGDWLPVGGELAPVGQQAWRPTTNGVVEVRFRARDRAGNWNEAKASVTVGGGLNSGPVAALPTANDPVIPKPAGSPSIQLVNSKRISLNFEIKEMGPSGVSAIELWVTQDGRKWEKYRDYKDRDAIKPPLLIDVQDEGLYGFTILARSGVDLAERPPQVGDQPQVWVEVDLTKPLVRLLGVEVGRLFEDRRNLTISWAASDKNLARNPVTLSYAETPEGPWTKIQEGVENTGRYVWQMPQGVPFKFLVKVEAVDRATNVGAAQTEKHVVVDLALPKVRILEVTPSSK